ncbi:HipA domain-containing protein [Herbiconiux sp. YIM B11900]|uniref:HipA domain-containing protein n=1 Tax=Herbiconiux sp. YIM B11900 TaxID=3404131 RepID=UPI003F832187
MSAELEVELYGTHAAVLTRLRADEYLLEYQPDWAARPDAVPLSLSLPLSSRRHRGEAVWNYLDNLLPDNPEVRERWARAAGLERTDPFALATHYGQDVAGAVSFRARGSATGGSRVPLSDADVAERIRIARLDATAWHDDSRPPDGQFSLGGTQAKFSLALQDGRWYETAGDHPSTHVFKPQVTGLVDGEIVEYVIMRAAAELGIPAARVEMASFEGEHSLVVERFDRAPGTEFPRRHQEDLAQSLGRPRLRKYERDRGPSSEEIARHLRAHGGPYAEQSGSRFVRMLAFSWIVLSTDAHTKNYSVFLDPSGALLTPLYDASSIIPYLGENGLDAESVRNRAADRTLAMRYGASYRAGDAGGFELSAIARSCGMPSTELLELAASYCLALPDVVEQIAAALPAPFRTDAVQRLVAWLPLRTRQALDALLPFL